MASLTAAAAAVPTQARDICWIDRVERMSGGVRVYFSDARTVTIIRPGSRGVTVFVDQDKPEAPTSDRLPAQVKRVEGALGDQFMSLNSGHDGCRLTVATQGDKIGLWAQAWMGMPGTRPGTSEKFIVAQ